MKLRYLFVLVGNIIGAGAGMLYWYIKECIGGSCAMSFDFTLDLFYGALLGSFFAYFLSQMVLRRHAED